jgi:hypothetical protein
MSATVKIDGRINRVSRLDIDRFTDAVLLANASEKRRHFISSTGVTVIVGPHLADLPVRQALRYLHDCLHGIIAYQTMGAR